MLRKLLVAGLPLVLIVILPIALRQTGAEDDPDADQLVIISPHNEAIRYELEAAFRRHYRRVHDRDVDIDWRTSGGTSEIVRYIKGAYTAAFRHRWTAAGKPWTSEIQAAILNRKLTQAAAGADEWQARQEFLGSDAGIGIDLFFGGGQYDFGKMAAQGVLVPCGVRERLPDLFAGTPPHLQQSVSGEIWYDPDDRYYGACLSSFGICWNLKRLAEIMGTDSETPVLRGWQDLGDPRLFGEVGVADPSKSGSINKCFEMLIQQQMAETVARFGGDSAGPATAADLDRGWAAAMLLIKRIGANARYFTFSASRVPVDVAHGDVAAGMCIDFYGRSQAEWERRHVGSEVMTYVTPEGGSSISADPIGMLRGAPHRDRAAEFIDFVLSREGQRLWNYRQGTPGGPGQYALRRLPIRRDVYTAEDRDRMSDGNARPFALAEQFTYRPEWTGRLFGLIRVLIRVMVIDSHQELKQAWSAVIQAGGPDAAPEAMATMNKLPFPHSQAADAAKALADPRRRLELTREWGEFFRSTYLQAANRVPPNSI